MIRLVSITDIQNRFFSQIINVNSIVFNCNYIHIQLDQFYKLKEICYYKVMFRLIKLVFVALLSSNVIGKRMESCGNNACEPAKGETWQTCVHDCCKTHDCDKEDNNVFHKSPPNHPGVGHIDERKKKVYRYHDDI